MKRLILAAALALAAALSFADTTIEWPAGCVVGAGGGTTLSTVTSIIIRKDPACPVMVSRPAADAGVPAVLPPVAPPTTPPVTAPPVVVTAPPPVVTPPVVVSPSSTVPANVSPIALYIDITSGPTSGGENNKGIYLSVFGKNFGSDPAKVKVYLGTAEVDNYRYFGPSRGRADIQQITAQIGSIAGQTGTLPITVVVNGVGSNRDLTFTVNPGAIYFVDTTKGVDTADMVSGGTFTAPFKTVQRQAGQRLSFAIEPATVSGAWGRVRAGDFIVLRGGTYTDSGYLGYFLHSMNKSGCALGVKCAQGGGTTTGPITVMGYPGETAFVNNVYNAKVDQGAISSADSARIAQGFGHYINVVNLRVEGGNHDGAVNTQAGGSNWRVVNNELTAATAVGNVTAKAGGIAGYGTNQFFVGNSIHDVYCGPDNANSNFENHGLYLSGGSGYEIAYNSITKIRGGNGISMYAPTMNVDNVNFHHNIVSNIGKHGVNIADQSRNGIRVWNNLVSNVDRGGVRFNSSVLKSAQVYNNAFVMTNRGKSEAVGAITTDDRSATMDVLNNIFVVTAGTRYDSGTEGLNANSGRIASNLWSGGNEAPPEKGATTGGFSFVSDIDFHLTPASKGIRGGSPLAAGIVTNDFDLKPRSSVLDIGPYQY